MTISEIKAAVDAGLCVHWANTGYEVVPDALGGYLVVYLRNGNAIGLTNKAGDRLNGVENDFFIASDAAF